MSQMPGPLTFCENNLKSGDLSVCPCKFVGCFLNILFQMHFPFPQKNLMQCAWCIKLRGKIGTKFLFNIKKESIIKSTDDGFKESMQKM